ncbi:MAG: radical SAM protein [Proteobacteria bacterium]|nr:radical SAM protein [Pseudomonadota bacterium]MBU1585528.1 radical SAM protein [Pseudomonadota bacterium]MBU2452363.1 radical SAM protein [Pseudomonadota bacterium]MBU2630034.1 radical SAM protein [Pseudomonadota bacterium]
MVAIKKILLVNPCCLDERISGEDARIVPIGLYYIGALLLENGFHTDIINLAEPQDDPVERFKRIVADKLPDVIGFSVTNPNRWNAIDCARTAKLLNPAITIVFGGPAPTFLFDHLFKVCPDIDFMVTGEGEITFLELVTQLETDPFGPFDQINGLVFKKEKQVLRTRPRMPVKVLDTLVHPSKYFTYQHLAMSRGCPGRCTFCGSPRFWGNTAVRFHSPKWVALEIETLVKKGITHFYISDDTFTMDKQQVIEFCRRIIDKQLNITWNAISRVDYIDKDILFAMRKAGCIQLSFGVESGSKKIQKRLGKPIDREKIRKAFFLTASYGILPRAYFIYGSSGETDETVQDSIDLLKDIKPLSAIFYMLVIFPGTHLYQTAVNRHLLTDDIWHGKIEDLPWFEVDDHLDFKIVKAFGDRLRSEFYNHLDTFARQVYLEDIKELYPFHADFLSRLALTFSHGEYATDTRVKHQDRTAKQLFEKALTYAPDARAFLGLAMLHQKQRRFDKAISILEKGIAHHCENKELTLCMGVCLMNIGRFKTALDFFEKIREFPETHHYINICHQKTAGHEYE